PGAGQAHSTPSWSLQRRAAPASRPDRPAAARAPGDPRRPRAAPLAGRRGPDLRRRLRARSLERDRRAPRGAVRRFREAATLPRPYPEPAAAPPRRLHALRPGRRRQPAALGATLPWPTDAGLPDVTGRRCRLPGSPRSAT